MARRKNKSRSQKTAQQQNILLATAIIQLITGIIVLIDKLIN